MIRYKLKLSEIVRQNIIYYFSKTYDNKSWKPTRQLLSFRILQLNSFGFVCCAQIFSLANLLARKRYFYTELCLADPTHKFLSNQRTEELDFAFYFCFICYFQLEISMKYVLLFWFFDTLSRVLLIQGKYNSFSSAYYSYFRAAFVWFFNISEAIFIAFEIAGSLVSTVMCSPLTGS